MDVEGELRAFFQAGEPDVAAAWLFGSFARGRARAASDVDVGVLLRTDPPRTLAGMPVDLEDRLQRLLQGRRVDLVVLNRASADLVHRVLRDGKLLADNDSSARIRFEVRKRSEYFDLKPFLDQYRAARPT